MDPEFKEKAFYVMIYDYFWDRYVILSEAIYLN